MSVERLGPGDRLSGLMRAARGLAVAIADADGKLVEWGEGAERMLGFAAADVVGSADLTLGHDPGELAAFAAATGAASGLAALLADARGQEDPRDWTFVGSGGTRFPVTRTISPIIDADGVIVGYAGLARDISRRRRIE